MKPFTLILALLMLLLLVGCNNSDDTTGTTETTRTLKITESSDTAGLNNSIDTMDETTHVAVVTEELPEPDETEVKNDAYLIKAYGLLSDDKVAAMNDFAAKNKITLEVVPQFVQGDMVVYTAERAIEEIPYRTTFLPAYRDIYYWGPSFLIDLVGREAAGKWHNEVVQPNIDNNTEPTEMYIVSFIKYFEITKDVFEKKCEENRAYSQMLHDEYGIDITGEGYEIPNADIIYTFDNEIINNYYLREQSNVELTK